VGKKLRPKDSAASNT